MAIDATASYMMPKTASDSSASPMLPLLSSTATMVQPVDKTSSNYSKGLGFSEYEVPFVGMLMDCTLESGMVSNGERLFNGLYKKNRCEALCFLDSVYIRYYSDRRVLLGILDIIANISYSDGFPTAQTMALGAISHKDDEVKEFAVRCYDHWHEKGSVEILKSIDTDAHWLRKYIDAVIHDITDDEGWTS